MDSLVVVEGVVDALVCGGSSSLFRSRFPSYDGDRRRDVPLCAINSRQGSLSLGSMSRPHSRAGTVRVMVLIGGCRAGWMISVTSRGQGDDHAHECEGKATADDGKASHQAGNGRCRRGPFARQQGLVLTRNPRDATNRNRTLGWSGSGDGGGGARPFPVLEVAGESRPRRQPRWAARPGPGWSSTAADRATARAG